MDGVFQVQESVGWGTERTLLPVSPRPSSGKCTQARSQSPALPWSAEHGVSGTMEHADFSDGTHGPSCRVVLQSAPPKTGGPPCSDDAVTTALLRSEKSCVIQPLPGECFYHNTVPFSFILFKNQGAGCSFKTE